MADDDDIFDSDEEQPQPSSSQTQSQTQPEVSKMVSDIFGDSDDDDDDDDGDTGGGGDGGDKWNRINSTSAPIVSTRQPSDDIFASDSEDEDDKATKRSPGANTLGDGLDDSDSDDAVKQTSLKKKKKKDRDGKSDKKKRKREERENRKAKKREKRMKKNKSKDSSGDKKGSGYDSGDSYDSGGEVERDADDDKFIDKTGDSDSDLEGYGGPQNFKDERPGPKKSKPKKELDPVSATIEYMKKKKAIVLSDTQKNQLSVDLYAKMVQAAKQDEVLVAGNQPAIAKVNFLPTVQRVMGIKAIQNSLLDNHILDAMNLWIEPKGEYLCSLTVRAAIYDMLKSMPCQIDHLRGSQIGKTILALRKHKKEIPDNKRVLKDIMEKWCRPIFSLSSDARGEVNTAKPELAHILKNKNIEEERRNEDGSQRREYSFEEQVAGNVRKKESGHERVKAPRSQGHMFTVRPTTSDDLEDKKSSGNVQSITTQKMKGKLKDLKSMVGKKQHSAMSVVLNGRNKQ